MVVGYQRNDVGSGYSMIAPCFVNVSGGNYAIDDLTLEGVGDGEATVQVVNADGTWGTQGFWLNAYGEYPAGWFTDATGAEAAEIALIPGQAVFFYTTSSDAIVQSAGQVAGVITNNVATGYSMIGNSTPVSIEIDDVTVDGAGDGEATVQVVNADGTWGTQGFWLNAYGEYPAGWFTDATGAEAAEITLEPGQSVFFYTSASNAKVLIPSAL